MRWSTLWNTSFAATIRIPKAQNSLSQLKVVMCTSPIHVISKSSKEAGKTITSGKILIQFDIARVRSA